MEVIYLIVSIVVAYWFYKGCKWVTYRNRYPIFSKLPPDGILSNGDYATFGEHKKQYHGIDRKHGDILYVFMPENSVVPCYHNKSYIDENMDSVYGRYGIKWKKIK